MSRLTTEVFISRAKNKFGDRYDYSKSTYSNTDTPLIIVCPVHGEFYQSPKLHLRSKTGCGKCGQIKSDQSNRRRASNDYIKKAILMHGDRYDYRKVNYSGSAEKITIICELHGEFRQGASSHLSGSNCPTCSKISRKIHAAKSKGPTVIARLAKKFQNLNFEMAEYLSWNKKIVVICPSHGKFYKSPKDILRSKSGCPKCGDVSGGNAQRLTKDKFIIRAAALHKDKYNYDKVEFSLTHDTIMVGCKCGEFEQKVYSHLSGVGCPKCCNTFSKPEQEVREFIQTLGFNPKKLRIKDGKGYREIDIFIEERKIGIEFNGVRFHSDEFKSKIYHIHKTQLAESKGISLIHIWENDWKYKKEIIKSRLKAILGKSTKIFARKTKVKELTWKESSDFLKTHHLKGPGQTTKIRYGLVHNGELVAVMTAGNARFKNEGLEIYRYASEGQVIGGMSKLLKHIERTLQPTTIISFADRCWGPGKVYEKIGFDKVSESSPSYVWVKSMRVKSRFSMQKHKLKNILNVFDPTLSEAENCRANNWYKLYDCGTVKWEKRL